MEVKVQYLGGVLFEAAARGHRILCDQPVENQGADTGMTPPEFLLASLGTCAGYYAAEYMRTRGIASQGLEVRVQADKVTGPARLGTFHIQVSVPNLDPQHEAGILRAVKACLIHNTLTHSPSIEIALETRIPATIG
ncbi:MAG TPA: OsmC family protein [Bryobacteraceae bacterium]|nr:OsmC family protein [Bryobacteraceae bacterium]